jgi:hypothetical protein
MVTAVTVSGEWCSSDFAQPRCEISQEFTREASLHEASFRRLLRTLFARAIHDLLTPTPRGSRAVHLLLLPLGPRSARARGGGGGGGALPLASEGLVGHLEPGLGLGIGLGLGLGLGIGS